MTIKRLCWLIFILALWCANAEAAYDIYVPVKIKGKYKIMHIDSVLNFNQKDAKATYTYDHPKGKATITIFTDENGNPVLGTHKAQWNTPGSTEYDTIIFNPDGKALHRITVVKDADDNVMESKAFNITAKNFVWQPITYTPSKPQQFVAATKQDAQGNWTEIHNYAGNEKMRKEAYLTRKVSKLSPEEKKLVQHYSQLGTQVVKRRSDSRTATITKCIWILVGCIVVGFFSRYPRFINIHLRPWMAVLVGVTSIIACGCMLNAMKKDDMATTGLIIAIVYMLIMVGYIWTMLSYLANDRELSNWEIKLPINILRWLLPLFGFVIGLDMYTLATGVLCGGIGVLAWFPLKQQGQRCPVCHRLNTIDTVSVINCGTKTYYSRFYGSGYTDVRTTVYEQVKELRQCYKCGYNYYTSVHDGELLSSRTHREDNPSPQKKSSSSRNTSTSRVSDECRHYHYDGSHRCNLGINNSCSYSNSGKKYCPYFSPRQS